MDLPRSRFLDDFAAPDTMSAGLAQDIERAAQRRDRRLAAWLYQGVPAVLCVLVFIWGLVLLAVVSHAEPARLIAWTVLVLGAAFAMLRVWRLPRLANPLTTMPEWRDAHRACLWVLGCTWGSAAFLVTPYLAASSPMLAWFLVPAGGFVLAVPSSPDERSALAASLPPFLMTLVALALGDSGFWTLGMAVGGAGVLSFAVLHAANGFARERAEMASRFASAFNAV